MPALGRFLRRQLMRHAGSPPVLMIEGLGSERLGSRPRPRALVSFLVQPLLPAQPAVNLVRFSLDGAAREMVAALNDLGYLVDVVAYDDRQWLPAREYDLFVGHGGVNFDRISAHLPGHAVRIYFSTGIYWRESNLREARRLWELASRRGFLLAPDRPIVESEESANQSADAIVLLGNDVAAMTYREFGNVVPINNGAYPVDPAVLDGKAFEAGRGHFLFFSGNGNVHKGLDRLLEAFVDSPHHLHICQTIDPIFERAYREELSRRTNIHLHGHIAMRSPEFHALAAQCDWVISATCAEGQPGAVLECMAHGLVPVLPDAAHIDMEDYGIQLPDCEPETINDRIAFASSLSVAEIQERAIACYAAVHSRYLPNNFRMAFGSAVAEIVRQCE